MLPSPIIFPRSFADRLVEKSKSLRLCFRAFRDLIRESERHVFPFACTRNRNQRAMKRALNVSGHVHRIDSEREEIFMDLRIGLLNCICVLGSEIMLRGMVKYFPITISITSFQVWTKERLVAENRESSGENPL